MIDFMTLKDSNTNLHLENTISVIKNADRKLFILAGCLSSSFTNDNRYIYELSNFIEKPHSSLEILLSNYDENSAKKSSNLLKRLAYYISTEYKDQIEIRLIHRNINFVEDGNKNPIYFLLNDRGGYCINNDYLSDALRFTPQKGVLSETLSKAFNELFAQANSLDILTLFNTSNNDKSK